MPFVVGLRRLSQLVIDGVKNWSGYRIDNVGAPDTADDVPRAQAADIVSGRFSMARMPDGASGQVLTAQGVGVNPAYAAAAGALSILTWVNPALTAFTTYTPRFFPLNSNGAPQAGESGTEIIMPSTATLKRLRVRVPTSTLNNVFTVTVRVNGVDTILTVTPPWGGSAFTGIASVNADVAVAENDLVSVRWSTPATSGSITIHPISIQLA